MHLFPISFEPAFIYSLRAEQRISFNDGRSKKKTRLFKQFSYAFTFMPKLTGIHSIIIYFWVHHGCDASAFFKFAWKKKLFKRNEKWLRNDRRNSVLLCKVFFPPYFGRFIPFIFLLKRLLLYFFKTAELHWFFLLRHEKFRSAISRNRVFQSRQRSNDDERRDWSDGFCWRTIAISDAMRMEMSERCGAAWREHSIMGHSIKQSTRIERELTPSSDDDRRNKFVLRFKATENFVLLFQRWLFFII